MERRHALWALVLSLAVPPAAAVSKCRDEHGNIVYLQTRTMPETAGWLTPFCRS